MSRYCQNIARISPRYCQDIVKIFPRYCQDAANMRPKYVQEFRKPKPVDKPTKMTGNPPRPRPLTIREMLMKMNNAKTEKAHRDTPKYTPELESPKCVSTEDTPNHPKLMRHLKMKYVLKVLPQSVPPARVKRLRMLKVLPQSVPPNTRQRQRVYH